MSIKIQGAVKLATDTLIDVFAEQDISNILLEEIDRNAQQHYMITLGFDRPASSRGASPTKPMSIVQPTRRVYKVACIDQETGETLWIKDRMLGHWRNEDCANDGATG